MALNSAFSSFLGRHYEHPILHASLDLIHLGIPWQPESPEELPAAPLHAVPHLIILLLLFAPLPAYLENSSPFHFDLHLFILYAWKVSFEYMSFWGLLPVNLHCGELRSFASRGWEVGEGRGEEAIEGVPNILREWNGDIGLSVAKETWNERHAWRLKKVIQTERN
ncbi:unnamed protein product [Camellia sinensis]